MREKFFSKNTRISRKKTMEKNRLEKVRKIVFFYENTNIVTKKWEGTKREKIFFQKHTYIASFKRWKKIVWKKCENTFFINTWIFWKNGGKTRKKIFPKKHSFRQQTTMEKNRLEKVRKHVFYKHTNIVTKNWGEKNARKFFFQKHTYIAR